MFYATFCETAYFDRLTPHIRHITASPSTASANMQDMLFNASFESDKQNSNTQTRF